MACPRSSPPQPPQPLEHRAALFDSQQICHAEVNQAVWHEHQNRTGEPAFLYSVTDEPTMRKLGLFREEARAADGRARELAALS